ncbi:MAG: CZB domain-containing protein, partial [bacterium]
MSWKNLRLRGKFGIGFGIVLSLLVITGGWAIFGIGGIVSNAKQVIDGNKLRGEMVQKEVDHLDWANHVSALLTDENVTELTVQTDPHKCAFGQWYYGDERRHAEALVPELKELFAEIEECHTNLHTSAASIGKVFHQADIHLPEFLTQKENDHLNWVNRCLELFAENLPKLDVETDHHKCGLGQFLYGEKGQKVAASDPELAALIEALKAPHEKLHASAIHIQESWQQRHEGLLDILKDRLDDHRKWAVNVAEAVLLRKKEVGVQTDPTKCAFGQFLSSDEAKAYMAGFPALKTALGACDEPHKRLHASAIAIESALNKGQLDEAAKIYQEQTTPALNQIAQHFGDAIQAEDAIIQSQQQAQEYFQSETLPKLADTQAALKALKNKAVAMVEGMAQANAIYATETKPNLAKVQQLLGEINTKVSENVMTDTQMLDAATQTRYAVVVISVIAVIAGIALAFIIARGIIRPLMKGVTFAQTVANGDLTQKVDVDQKDEIGILASALNVMSENLRDVMGSIQQSAEQVASSSEELSASAQNLSSATTEQASSLEETSSAIEELT